MRKLVYHFAKGCESGRQLLTDLETASPELELGEVKCSTFFDAFQRFPVAWFASLLAFLLGAVMWQAIPELAALGKLYCVDGSLFPAIASMLWAEYTSQHRAIRLHLCFELNRMIPAHFLVDTGNSNEKKALLQMLEAGVTYIADRGYLSFPLLAAIVAANAFFVIRDKVNLVYTCVEQLPVTLPGTVQHLFQHVTDRRVRLKNAKGQPLYRLVSFFVGRERYLILTNRMDLTTFQVILLYAYRWQVGIDYRHIKTTLEMDEFNVKSPQMFRKELAAGLLTYNLICALMVKAALKANLSPTRLSFSRCWRRVRDLLVQGVPGWVVAQESVEDYVLDRLAKCTLPRQPNKVAHEPRKVRRRPAVFPALKGDRQVARQQVLQELSGETIS